MRVWIVGLGRSDLGMARSLDGIERNDMGI